MEWSSQARRLYGHLDGTAIKPADPPTWPDGHTLTAEEVSSNKQHLKDLSLYLQHQAIVFQQIASTIPDSLYLKIKGKATVKEAWDALKDNFKKWSRMFMIELRKHLQDTRCSKNGNICTHFDNLRTMREELASLSNALSNPDFSTTILGSLPKSYDQFLSTVTTTASILKQELNSEDLMQSIIDEYDWHLSRPGAPKERAQDAAFYARGGSSSNWSGKKLSKDIECFNCHKKWHKKPDCWVKGGGKEGQDPRSKDWKGKGGDSKEGGTELANAVGDEDGVWMAFVDNSGDEDMADTKFDNFRVCQDDLLLLDDATDDEDGDFDIVTHLKALSSDSNHSKHIEYPYDDPKDFFDTQDFTDSSNDEGAAAAMQAMLDSDNEVKIDPYWSRISVDELKSLGNPTKVLKYDSDSMPELDGKSVSTASDDSMPLLRTILDSSCDNSCRKGYYKADFDLFGDADMVNLVVDSGEDGYTTFNAAMLVNVKGSVEGIQTELYDSGASCHMSPYREHFENYIHIILKSITVADKRYFQAVGKGDLRIKLPNGPSTTTVLLKDVLHCPDMGLTLISIGKIAAVGCKVIFRVYDAKNKMIGQVVIKNGLYHVDHDITVNVALAGVAREVLTVEELHRHMGHIAPETAKQMVSEGAIDGMEVNLSSTIQSCNSCEYAKATCKPIWKSCEASQALKFGGKIHSDVWGPSPIQTLGHKEFYMSFTDDYTQWTTMGYLKSKPYVQTKGENTWVWNLVSILHPRELLKNTPPMTLQSTMGYLNVSTKHFRSEPTPYYIQVSFLKICGEKWLIMLSG